MDSSTIEEPIDTIAAWFLRERPRSAAEQLIDEATYDAPLDDPLEERLRDLALDTSTHLTVRDSVSNRWIHKYFDQPAPELFHLFVPPEGDATPDEDRHYCRVWTAADQPLGSASTKLPVGQFSASQYRTSGYAQGLAGLGVVFSPVSEWCWLSVRPFVQYSGSSYLSGRRPPDAWESARSTSWGSVGILVESWAVGGGSHHVDEDKPVALWEHSEVNPTRSWRDYGGSVTVTDGLTANVFATRHRRYRIWVYCWAEVAGQMLTSAGAYASSSIGCTMPYLAVEETPA